MDFMVILLVRCLFLVYLFIMEPFEDFFIDVDRIPVPTEENFKNIKQQFKKLITEHKVAAFIYEPLVQGAAAMKMYNGNLLDELN